MGTVRFDHDDREWTFDDRWMDVPTCMFVRRRLGLSITDWATGMQPASYDAAALVAMVHTAMRRAGAEVRLEDLLAAGTVDLMALVSSIARHKQAELDRRLAEIAAQTAGAEPVDTDQSVEDDPGESPDVGDDATPGPVPPG